MDLNKQIRKAAAAADEAVRAGNYQKACYIRELAEMMVASARAGQPQPWSNYAPMVAEEFDE